ncbi:LLM class flavin-dependent oxidoreductase [Streptomyces sp. NPDC006739]|uniref:LLM class flavin-dependent oxidoreductase n=1 Tax=Streptomyces sp. NPDC006739 TaxID=3364763 RepID=UPI0036775F0D
MTVRPRGRIHLAVLARSRTGFSSLERLARTAERGLFDFLLLADGPGPVRDSDPEPRAVLGALAGVTERLGLAAPVDPAVAEPYEAARGLATLDHLSGGRAAWNVPASPRAAELVAVARELWESWTPEGVARPVAHQGRHFDLAGEFGLPRSPQGHPVVIHARGHHEDGDDWGDGGGRESGASREFAAASADVIVGRRGSPEADRAFRADMRRRLPQYGRAPRDLRIMSGVTVVLGDTDAEARRRASSLSGRPSFLGTPEAVAAQLEESAREEAADGFVLLPHPAPGGLDEFVDRVVPLLQERGVFRTEYDGATLRSHLGLPVPVWKG